MTEKEIKLAVANQIQNMMYNDITEGYGLESFEAWCDDGEVFEEEGMSKEEAEECMALVRKIAPKVDDLLLNDLNVDMC